MEGEEGGGFLAEVLDIRERIEGAESLAEVEALGRENEERVKSSEEALGRFLEEGRWGEARREVSRLRYWVGVGEVVGSWGEGEGEDERGEGVGMKGKGEWEGEGEGSR